MLLLYPLVVLETATLWSVINEETGQETVNLMLDLGIDPVPRFERLLSEKPTLCTADDPRVIAAQEKGFL